MSRLISPARVLSLIISDIVGDPVEMIASGPTIQVIINKVPIIIENSERKCIA